MKVHSLNPLCNGSLIRTVDFGDGMVVLVS